MKRLLLIGFAACTLALAPMLSASAMPIATRMHLRAIAAQSSKSMAGDITVDGDITVAAVITMDGDITVAEVITMDGVEVITMDGVIIVAGVIVTGSSGYCSERSRLSLAAFSFEPLPRRP